MPARSATGKENDNTERHQQHQDRPDAARLHSSIRNATGQYRESRDGHTPQPEISATQGSRGASHEPARKRTKTGIITRNLPQTSCLRCKSKKIKCVPSDVMGGICKKCESGHHECNYQIRGEKQRNESWKRRIDQLERTLSHIKGSVIESDLSDNPSTSVDPTHEVGNVQTKEARVNRLEQSLLEFRDSGMHRMENHVHASNRGTFAAYGTDPPLYLPSNNNLSKSLQNEVYLDVIDRGILDLGKAHALLEEFKTMSYNFPYIVVTPNSSASTLRRESPMLLLAICAAASWRDRKLQTVLEKVYLEELGARMVVKGEQTLDMLQGLLVHLSWCHFHLRSSYRLTSIAISLVTTLGFNHHPSPPGRQNLGVAFPFPNSAPPPPVHAKSWSPAIRRAYIGAYVICSSYAHALRKTSVLKYTSYLEDCALSVPRESGLQSDALLIHHVRIAHHAETISDTFDYDLSRSVPSPPDSQLLFHVRAFSTAISNIESQIPSPLARNPLLSASLLITAAYTHEVGLHGLRPHDVLSLPRTTILIDCLGAVKRVLDALAAFGDLDFRSLLGFNWARIHYSISLAVELSLGITSPSWSVEAVRSVLALEEYIDVFVARLEGLSALVRKDDGEGDWFGFLAAHWTELRRNYSKRMGDKGVIVPGGELVATIGEGWLGLGDMDFMPNEWLWMVPDGGM